MVNLPMAFQTAARAIPASIKADALS